MTVLNQFQQDFRSMEIFRYSIPPFEFLVWWIKMDTVLEALKGCWGILINLEIFKLS